MSPFVNRFARSVPLPPMPADPLLTCRWCLGDMHRESETVAHCPNGCAPANAIPAVRATCDDCDRRFLTGQPKAWICWQCHTKEKAQVAAEYDGGPDLKITGYLHDRRKFGANQRVMEAKKKEA